MLGILMLLLALAGGGISACSTNTFVTPETPGTTEGTYTRTVIGTSGAITESGTVSLTVQ
jgi:ABC-type Fe3+-hydroxamate transport system substrate-binding protein